MVTQDAIHYREPIRGFRFIPVGNTLIEDTLIGLFQGQGMHNVGDQTLYWYSSTHSGRVRLATWERDRLGYLQPLVPPLGPWSFITCPFSVEHPTEVLVNVSMAKSPTPRFAGQAVTHREMRFEVLGSDLRPLEGFGASDSAPVTGSFFDAPVTWKNAKTLPLNRGPLRIRGLFDGNRPEDIHFHALYLREQNNSEEL
jgi:hypothetical protein